MKNTDIEMLEKYKKRVKAQNEAAKENWDTVSCRLPKGTKDRIKALGLTVNGVINDSVLSFLEQAENERNTDIFERSEAQTGQTGQQEKYQTKQQDEIVKEQPKPEMKSNNNVYKKPMTLDDVQEIIDKKKAEQKEREEMLEKARQEKKENEKAERKKMKEKVIDSIRNQEEEQ